MSATAPEGDSRSMPLALLVFAHPDDETIALGGRLTRFGNAFMIHVTDGAPVSGIDQIAHGFGSLLDYRNVRRQELDCALSLAGLSEMRRECFGVPDQEASLQLASLARRVAQSIRDFHPLVVFTHPFEGGHPDHDACAFAVHRAIKILKCHGEQVPLIIEAPFYHAAQDRFETGSFLPTPQNLPEVVYSLTPSEQQRKKELIDCFTSQRETLSVFRTEEERYRIAPDYEFRRVPHPGPILYDQHSWGVTSQGFLNLAWEAGDVLDEETNVPCR